MEIFLGILIPFIGTMLGAACVFFMKKALKKQVQRALAGFASKKDYIARKSGSRICSLEPEKFRIPSSRILQSSRERALRSA